MSTMYCPNCGAPNTADSAFCASCGTSLTAPTEIIPPPSPPPTAPPPPPPPMISEQPQLTSDGEPYLVNKSSRYHRLWQEKRFSELLVAWERKVAEAEINAVKGNGLPIALIIIGIILLGGFVGIILLIAGIYLYSKRSSARKNLSAYQAVLSYLRTYVGN
ncbi:MAG: zinc ribbon domain-containing protein [Promethearchaeota archaeon]